MKKVHTVSLTEFVRRFPVFKSSFKNLLSDPEYIVKYVVDSKGNFLCIEYGYAADYFGIENLYR